MLTGALTPTQTVILVLVTLVALVVVSGLLENRTPGGGRRRARAAARSGGSGRPVAPSGRSASPSVESAPAPSGTAGAAPAMSRPGGPVDEGGSAPAAGELAPPPGGHLPAVVTTPAEQAAETAGSASNGGSNEGEPTSAGPAAATSGPAGEGRKGDSDGETLTSLARIGESGGAAVELGPPGSAEDLAAVLFAAYVVSGRPERARVTGWVAPAGTPPSLAALGRGEHLRGRPGRVKALLRCTDEGRNWIRLDPDTDIALGLTRRPPTDDCLRGIAWWWTLASGRVRRIPAEQVGVVREGLEAVVGSLDGHPLAGTASRLAGLTGEAERRAEPVRIETLPVAEFERRASGRARLAGGSG